MDSAYINYCEHFLKRNPENFRRFGFQNLSDLASEPRWYQLIDTKLPKIDLRDPRGKLVLQKDLYFDALSKVFKSLSGLIEINANDFNFRKTVGRAFSRRTNNPSIKTLEIIEKIFEIDISPSIYNTEGKSKTSKSACLREQANICTYVTLDYAEIIRRKVCMLSVMENLIDFDLKNFPRSSIINDEIDMQYWVNIFTANPFFWRVAFVNNRVVGYFNYHLVGADFYERWKLGSDEVIDLIKEIGVLGADGNEDKLWIYLDVLCIDEDDVVLGNYLHSLIYKDLIDQLAIGMRYLQERGTALSGIIANGFTRSGAALLRHRGFEAIGNHTIGGLNGFITQMFELNGEKFEQFKSYHIR